MNYNFDKRIDRIRSKSVKWNPEILEGLFGKSDLLPLWVADMDFRVAEPIIEAMEKEVAHGIFGYSRRPESYYDALISWYDKRFSWKIEKEWIVYSVGVVSAINFIFEAFCDKKDGVIIQEPVYFPFKSCILRNDLKVIINPLNNKNGCFEMDLNDFEKKASDPSTKIFILCSPHNPVGRVWNRETLKTIGEICKKHNVLVVSDEVHHDLVYEKKHHIYASIDKEMCDNCIILTAPSKTFNVVGLQTSHLIIPDENIREAYMKPVERKHVISQNPISMAGIEAAYTSGDQWLEQLLSYLKRNINTIDEFLKVNLPKAKWHRPEATYLAWIDLSAYKKDIDRIIEISGVAIIKGERFGIGGENYIRINFACPGDILMEALNGLLKGIRYAEKL